MGKPRMQTSGTGRKTDASCHLEKKTTSLVNRQGGFEGVPWGGKNMSEEERAALMAEASK